MLKYLKLGFVGLLIFAGSVTLTATDWYVKVGGAGRGSSPSEPVDAIWKAMDRAVRGDVIHVAAGTYNGKGGAGHFVAKVPNLTLVGGYNADFSKRDPFKNYTILERAKDYKGDWTGLPEGIIAGDGDHSGLVVDGFVLNAESRNSYKDNVLALKAPSYPGMLIQTNSENIKIRNNILLNPVGSGIYSTWKGKDNEIVNNFIVNTLYTAIETRSAQPGSRILIKNNTIAYGWFYPSKGGHIGIFVGSQGQTVIEDNVFAFIQTEDDSSGFGVTNTFGNLDTEMKGNLFFSTSGGFYKYMDSDKKNLVVWKAGDLAELNDEFLAMDFMLNATGENREADPGLKPDKAFTSMFLGYQASVPGKLNMDALNQWRQTYGLPLQADASSARKNYAFAYPLAGVVPGLVSSIAGVGARPLTTWGVYKSESVTSEALNYQTVAFDDFKKGGPKAKGNTGTPVAVKGGMGDAKTNYEVASAPKSDYLCYQITRPGATSATTRDVIHIYILKGSPAQKAWDTYFRKRGDYFAEGLTFKGRAYDFTNQSYTYPVGIIVDEIKR